MRPFKLLFALVLSFLASQTVVQADPLTCTISFEWANRLNSFWSEQANWSLGRVPNENDNVCITGLSAGEHVVIVQQFGSYAAKAKAIWIDATSALEIYGDETLTLYGGTPVQASYIDGLIEVCPPFDLGGSGAGRIILDKSLTITASGSTGLRSLYLHHATAAIEASPGSGAVLTVGSGLTIAGTGNIKLPAVNNGTMIANIADPELELSGELYFYEALTLNGTLRIEPVGTAFLTANQTVPSGGLIELQASGNDIGKLKARSGYAPQITVFSGGNIRGAGEVHLKITNNGKVAARDGTLELKGGGDGSNSAAIWAAETSTGRLWITSEVRGQATWELIDNAGAKIEFDYPCVCLDGNVNIYQGTFDVDADFQTGGDIDISGKDSLIDVAGGKSAKFDFPHMCDM